MSALIRLAVAVAALVCTPVAGAATFTATQSGPWNQAATWGGSGPPGTADTAVVGTGFTVDVTAAAAVANLDLDGTLDLEGAVLTLGGPSSDVAGAASVTSTGGGLSLTGSATLTVANGAGTFAPGALTIAGFGLGVGGRLTLHRAATIGALAINNGIRAGSGTLTATSVTQLRNASFEGAGTTVLPSATVEAGMRIINSAVLEVAAGATVTSTVTVGLANTARWLVKGTLALGTASVTHTTTPSTCAATLEVAAGGTVEASDTNGALAGTGPTINVPVEIDGAWETAAAGSSSLTCGGTVTGSFDTTGDVFLSTRNSAQEYVVEPTGAASGTGRIQLQAVSFDSRLTIEPGAGVFAPGVLGLLQAAGRSAILDVQRDLAVGKFETSGGTRTGDADLTAATAGIAGPDDSPTVLAGDGDTTLHGGRISGPVKLEDDQLLDLAGSDVRIGIAVIKPDPNAGVRVSGTATVDFASTIDEATVSGTLVIDDSPVLADPTTVITTNGIGVSPAGTLVVRDGTLDGDVNGRGTTIVEAGGLVRGAVGQGTGTLMGDGTIEGDVMLLGATLAPGLSPGTLTIDGDLTLGPDATYAVELTGAAHDRVNVSGTATLAGTLAVTNAGATDARRIVEAGTRTGTFATVTGAAPYAVTYDATGVTLTPPVSLGPPGPPPSPGVPPPLPSVVVAPVVSRPAAPVAVRTDAQLRRSLPSARRCISRRRFRIRLAKRTDARKYVRAEIRVDGKRVKTVTRARIGAAIDLRGLTKKTVVVRITATLDDGTQVRAERRYKTCTPKKARRR